MIKDALVLNVGLVNIVKQIYRGGKNKMECYLNNLTFEYAGCGYITFMNGWLLMLLSLILGICATIIYQILRDYQIIFRTRRNK